MAKRKTSVKSKASDSREKAQRQKTTGVKQKTPPKREGRQKSVRSVEQLRQQNQRWAVVLFACALLVGFLVFVEGESVWLWLHNALLGLFGAAAILWPIFLLYVAVITALEKVQDNLRVKLLLSVLLIIMFCSALYIFRADSLPRETSYWAMLKLLYAKGVARESVGFVSGVLGYPIVLLLGAVGSKIFIILVLFVGIMLLTGTSLIQLGRLVRRPVDQAVHNFSEAREARELHSLSQEKARNDEIDIPLGPSVIGEPEAGSAAVLRESNEKLDRLLSVFGVEHAAQDPVEEEETAALRKGAAPQIQSDTTLQDLLTPEQKKNKKAPDFSKPVQTTIFTDAPPSDGEYHFPPISMLESSQTQNPALEAEELKTNATLLVETLKSFGVTVKILDISRGPAVTRYEVQPAAGVKISKITNLADDLAMNLAASGVRIEAPIPGKAAVGIEVPNKHKYMVRMRDLVESKSFSTAKSKLAVTLGRDIAGQAVIADLAKMPHLLIAGTTGSGKSVCVNSFIISLLYRSTPKEVRLLMVDPKVVELRVYNGIPHLLIPVVTDPRKAAGALNWAVGEMMNRYKLFAEYNVRDLPAYNRMVRTAKLTDSEGNRLEEKPQIVIIIDELADLMMVAPNEVEDAVCRLAQLARAAGIHLVVATQRPSVDVITGLIKANIPSRLALTVASLFDSRTILDVGGAEKLLGYGDMLFAPVGSLKPLRVQGCYVSDDEIESIVNFVKQTQEHEYDEEILDQIEKNAIADSEKETKEDNEFEDPMMAEAIKCVVEAGQASTSLLQRRLRLGYARAGRLIDQMEQAGVVGPHEGSKPRQVLITYQQWLEMNMQKADAQDG